MTEQNRLEQCKELRSGNRGSGNVLVGGNDLATDRHHVFFGTPEGRSLKKKLLFDNSITRIKVKLAARRQEVCLDSLMGTISGTIDPPEE